MACQSPITFFFRHPVYAWSHGRFLTNNCIAMKTLLTVIEDYQFNVFNLCFRIPEMQLTVIWVCIWTGPINCPSSYSYLSVLSSLQEAQISNLVYAVHSNVSQDPHILFNLKTTVNRLFISVNANVVEIKVQATPILIRTLQAIQLSNNNAALSGLRRWKNNSA